MKFIYLLLFIFGCSHNVKAEYDSFIVDFQIVTINYDTIEGFHQVYVDGYYHNDRPSDSLLISSLYTNYASEDTLHFASNKIAYDVHFYSPDSFVYQTNILLDNREIAKGDIQEIVIFDCIWQSTLESCYFSYPLNDLSWLKKKPIEIFSYHPYCEFYFFIHEWSPRLREIMNSIDDIEIPVNSSSYETVEEFQELINEIENEKVVILQGW